LNQSSDLVHVFGYRGYDARSNIDFLLSAEGLDENNAKFIFHTAGIAIIQSFKADKKQYFYSEHSDDILCLCQNKHPSYRAVVATGQLGNGR
jgi:hypothetical protein